MKFKIMNYQDVLIELTQRSKEEEKCKKLLEEHTEYFDENEEHNENYLVIYASDTNTIIGIEWDHMDQPECTNFYKDLAWVPKRLEEAFNIGYKMGIKKGKNIQYQLYAPDE